MKREIRLRRVVVTGLGVIAPNGSELDVFWSSVRDGRSAGAQITRIDPTGTPGKIAAEVKKFDPIAYVGLKKSRRIDLASQYAIAAAKKALLDSGLDMTKVDRKRVGVVEGTSLSAMDGLVRIHGEVAKGGYKNVSFYSILNGYNGSASGEVAQEIGARGHAVTFCSGSASGNDSIGYGLKMIQTGEVDIMVAGGSEAPIVDDIWAAFCKAEVMTRGADPFGSMKPFDRLRDGFLLGEGSAFLILEDLEHAMNRGARIYAEILGHGRSCEAYHSLAPHPEGVGVSESIAKAMELSGIRPEQVDYINAHGTATVANDTAETRGIRAYFGEAAGRIAVSSTKPVTGHLLGAAGAIEAVICTLAVKHQEVPPTLNISNPDEGCDLDYVSTGARKRNLGVVLSLNCGFGGKNSCLIVGKFDEKAAA